MRTHDFPIIYISNSNVFYQILRSLVVMTGPCQICPAQTRVQFPARKSILTFSINFGQSYNLKTLCTVRFGMAWT